MLRRMTTRSVGRSIAAPRGGRTGGRIGRGGGRIREPTGRFGGRTGDQDGQGGNRGNGTNGGIDEVFDFSIVIAQQLQNLLPTIIAQVCNHASNIHSNVRNVSVNNGRGDCSYKELLACSDKGSGSHSFHMTWEDFKALMREEFCPNNEMQKLEIKFGVMSWSEMVMQPPATKSILDELLEEFRDKIVNVTMDDEKDAKDPQSYFTEMQVNGEMKSPSKYGLKSSFPYSVANEHPNGVYCYFHPHLIYSEGLDTRLPSFSKDRAEFEIISTRKHMATKWFKRLVAYAKCNRDSYESFSRDRAEFEIISTRKHMVKLLLT
nr:hypothetical protein [Tanacetum cinerariifolium]